MKWQVTPIISNEDEKRRLCCRLLNGQVVLNQFQSVTGKARLRSAKPTAAAGAATFAGATVGTEGAAGQAARSTAVWDESSFLTAQACWGGDITWLSKHLILLGQYLRYWPDQSKSNLNSTWKTCFTYWFKLADELTGISALKWVKCEIYCSPIGFKRLPAYSK